MRVALQNALFLVLFVSFVHRADAATASRAARPATARRSAPAPAAAPARLSQAESDSLTAAILKDRADTE